jgi:hypothetical protein
MSLRAFVAKQHLHCVPAHVSPVFKQYYGEFEPGDCFLTGCYAIVGENTLLGTTLVAGDCFARAAHKASMSVGRVELGKVPARFAGRTWI